MCPVTKSACSSSTTPAVFQALAFVPVVTVYVCGWCTAGDRTTTTFRRPMQQSNTHRRTSYQECEAYSGSNSTTVAHTCRYISLEHFPPSRLATPPVYQVNSIPKRNLTCNVLNSTGLVGITCRAVIFFFGVQLFPPPYRLQIET